MAQTYPPPKDRLLSRSKRRRNGCVEWMGCRDKDGYGKIYVNGKHTRCHVLSYLLFVGDVPKGMFVCHHCDNPSCINPKHLFVGTHTANMHDMLKKGRDNYARGDSHYKRRKKGVL